jgi:hypothetical protein
MRWYGEKMLPNGLPQLIRKITPVEVSKKTDIITFNRKHECRIAGRYKYENNKIIIHLYPTVILDWLILQDDDVLSFTYWMALLKVALHEVGHAVMEKKYRILPEGDTTKYMKRIYMLSIWQIGGAIK